MPIQKTYGGVGHLLRAKDLARVFHCLWMGKNCICILRMGNYSTEPPLYLLESISNNYQDSQLYIYTRASFDFDTRDRKRKARAKGRRIASLCLAHLRASPSCLEKPKLVLCLIMEQPERTAYGIHTFSSALQKPIKHLACLLRKEITLQARLTGCDQLMMISTGQIYLSTPTRRTEREWDIEIEVGKM